MERLAGSGVRKSFRDQFAEESEAADRKKNYILLGAFILGCLFLTGCLLIFFLDIVVSLHELYLFTSTSCVVRYKEVQSVYFSSTDQRWRALYQVDTEYKGLRNRIGLPTDYPNDGFRTNRDQAVQDMQTFQINATYACWAPSSPVPFNPDSDFIGAPMDFIYDSYSTGNVKTGFILMMLLACVLGLLGLAGVLVPSYIKVKQWISEGWHPFYESVPDGEDENDDDDESMAMNRYNRRSSGSGGEGMNKSRSGQWVLDDDDEEGGGGKRAKRQAQKEAKRATKREKEEKKRREKKEKLRAKLYGK